MRVSELIAQVRASQARVQAERKKHRDAVEAVRQACADADRDPTNDEAAQVREAAEACRAADTELETIGTRLAQLEDEQRQDAALDALARTLTPVVPSHNAPERNSNMTQTSQWRVTEGERQYRADDAQNGKPSFLSDLYAAQVKRDPAANERLARHGHEVEVDNPGFAARAVNTGAVSGFVPPAYLVDLWAELARAGRPVANLCTSLPLPERGMTVNVPRVTTGTAVGVQASENATVTNQDLDDTLLTVPVATIAGYTDVSRQAIERGDVVQELILGDLAADYNAKLDAQVISGTGSSGQHTGLLTLSGTNTITYTDASPTQQELWPKVADAIRKVTSQRYTGPTAIVMTPMAWGWLVSALDSAGRPLMDVESAGQNVLGKSTAPGYKGAAGQLFGVPVYLSGNVPANLGAGTNETAIITADFRDVLLFEDASKAPAQLRFDEPLSSSLGVRLLAYGYSALAAGRQPTAISKVVGTGLIIPASL